MLLRFLLLFATFGFAENLDLPVRIQWEANGGYCGETSMICAGLYYGQYMSQYDVRALVTNIGSQKDQLLLGINDDKAATKMHLDFECWDNDFQESTDQFLEWVKQNVEKGYPVVIGLYINQSVMYGDPNPDDGDPDYDHIVPVTGLDSSHGSNLIYYSDNGLWDMSQNHLFNSTFDAFQATRRQANGMNAPVYSLSKCNPNKNLYNYGIAIKGVKGDTLPVRVATSTNSEIPAIADGSERRPSATPLTLTVTVSNLEPNAVYHLYRYKDLELVPESDFNAHSSNASKCWRIQVPSGSTYTMTETIQSDDIAVYRAVKATAP
jgi:hypothetical protein